MGLLVVVVARVTPGAAHGFGLGHLDRGSTVPQFFKACHLFDFGQLYGSFRNCSFPFYWIMCIGRKGVVAVGSHIIFHIRLKDITNVQFFHFRLGQS
jgi:hypothetical protein